MKRLRHSRLVGGFTLMELLCVMGIIAILAALLLPAINQAKQRAKRVVCVNHLRETGLAFHIFANDHRGKLPMQVPAKADGSAEFVQATVEASGESHFAFRHFQTLANELATPRMLACPADTRLPADHFVALKNECVSYFVNVSAEHGKSTSLLAGDRNLTNDLAGGRGLLSLDANSYLRWTHELHRFKGNVLFGDGHVEELNRALMFSSLDPTATARLALPSVGADLPSASRGPVQPDAAAGDTTRGNSPKMPASNATSAWTTLGTSAPPAGSATPVSTASDSPQAGFHAGIRAASEASSPSNRAKPTILATNQPGRVPASRAGDDAMLGTFDLRLVEFLQGVVKRAYLLWLLLLLVYLGFRLWQWERRRLRQQRSKRPNW